jgi:hypothetical protein
VIGFKYLTVINLVSLMRYLDVQLTCLRGEFVKHPRQI